MTRLLFDGAAKGGVEKVVVEIEDVVIAGRTSRDAEALYQRVSANLLTQADTVQMPGAGSSGEAEPVLVGATDRLWVTVGAVSTPIGAKPVGRTAWRFEEVEPHWDRLVLRSFIEEDGKRTLYQEGPLARIGRPRELIAGWRGDKRLPAGVVMFCGALPAIGPIRPTKRFEMELEDPVLGRKIAHGYHVQSVPIVS